MRLSVRIACLICVLGLCMGLQWPGRRTRMLYELAHGTPEQRLSMARQLADHPAQDVTEGLLRALEDDELDVRLAAAQALGRFNAAQARPALLDWLQDPEPRLRAVALATIAELPDESAAPALPVLITALSDTQPEVRVAALRGLAARVEGSASASDELVAPLLSSVEDAAPEVRLAAVHVLSELVDERALPALHSATRDDVLEIRKAAVLGLGAQGDVRALAALSQALSDPELRMTAIRALGTLGSGDGIPLLEPLFSSSEPRVAQAALAALARIDDPRAHELLATHLQDAELAQVARAALSEQQRRFDQQLPLHADDALAGFTREASTLEAAPIPPSEREPSDQGSPGARELAALRMLGTHQAALQVAQGIRSADPQARRAATHALSSFDSDDTRGLLRYLLQRGAPDLAPTAITSLAEIGDQRDVPNLLRAQSRMHWPVPGTVSYAIARMARRDVLKKLASVRVLCKLGQSRDRYVRANIAAALAQLSAGPCDGQVHPLRWLQPEHAAAVRAASARWALAAARAGQLPEPEVARALATCSQDTDVSVARACSRPSAPPRDVTTLVTVYGPDGETLLRERMVALRFADGSVFLGDTDEHGEVLLHAAPDGPVVSEDPASAAREP